MIRPEDVFGKEDIEILQTKIGIKGKSLNYAVWLYAINSLCKNVQVETTEIVEEPTVVEEESDYIKCLPLGSRAKNLLVKLKITDRDGLAGLTREFLSSQRGAGEKTIAEIMAVVEEISPPPAVQEEEPLPHGNLSKFMKYANDADIGSAIDLFKKLRPKITKEEVASIALAQGFVKNDPSTHSKFIYGLLDNIPAQSENKITLIDAIEKYKDKLDVSDLRDALSNIKNLFVHDIDALILKANQKFDELNKDDMALSLYFE